jgi:hypothetical protein
VFLFVIKNVEVIVGIGMSVMYIVTSHIINSAILMEVHEALLSALHI